MLVSPANPDGDIELDKNFVVEENMGGGKRSKDIVEDQEAMGGCGGHVDMEGIEDKEEAANVYEIFSNGCLEESFDVNRTSASRNSGHLGPEFRDNFVSSGPGFLRIGCSSQRAHHG